VNVRKLKSLISNKISAEIPKELTYHGLHHTLSVYEVCNQYIKRMNIKPKDAYLLRTAALTHDVGILYQYKNHEDKGIEYVHDLLPELGYSKKDIDIVCGLIEATRLPQNPKNTLEKIICDADLDYIGTDEFYSIGNTLFEEFLSHKIVKDEEDWDKLQIRFLEEHDYHTPYAKKHREPVKQKFLKELKIKWGLNGN